MRAIEYCMIALLLTGTGVVRAGADGAPATPAAATPGPGRHVYLIGPLRVTKAAIDTAAADAQGTPAYLVVENRSGAAERLMGATVGGGGSVSLVQADGGAVGPDGLVIGPNATLTLEPRGPHMLIGGFANLARDASTEAVLSFGRLGTMRIAFAPLQGSAAGGEDEKPAPDAPMSLAQ